MARNDLMASWDSFACVFSLATFVRWCGLVCGHLVWDSLLPVPGYLFLLGLGSFQL